MRGGDAARTIRWTPCAEANRFERDTEKLGEEGALLRARFDRQMDPLHATQFSSDDRAADSTR